MLFKVPGGTSNARFAGYGDGARLGWVVKLAVTSLRRN
jgi:hypothetical protein